MKMLQMLQPKDLQICDVETPQLEAGKALVKIHYCGICGSDLTAYTGKNPTVRYPINAIGHEGVGVILEIGKNDRGLRKGDLVALEPYIPCLKCHSCAEERYNNCVDIRVAGVHTGGVMAETVSFPIHLLHKLPEHMDMLKAALIEPLTIGLHAAARAKVKKGEHCVIIGAGPIGILAALGVKAKGAFPILVDIVEERLQLVRDCGIKTCNSAKTDVFAYLKELTGTLPSAMLECTGAAPILKTMHDYVRHGGRIALVGWPKGEVIVNTVRCIQKELDIYPSRNSNKQFPQAIEMIANGHIPCEKLITKVIGIDEVQETILDMIAHPENYMKVVVKL